MSGGKLNVTAGVFSQNGPSITDFPSARQNIHCEREGLLVIDSLAKGDGSRSRPSAWIDAADYKKQEEGGNTSRSWIVGLVVGIGVLALIVILLLVVLGVRSHASKKERTPSQSEMDETDQIEMKMDDVNEMNRHSGDMSFDVIGSKSIVVESSVSDFTQLEFSKEKRTEREDPLEMVEVMNATNPVSVTHLTRHCSLYNRLHGTNQVGFSKRQVRLELARGVELIAMTDSSAQILTTLSPHWIFLDSQNKVFFQTKATNDQGTFFGSGLGESGDKVRIRERVEDQRWQAPEMVKGGEMAEMEKAVVFSLGLLLWELETGEIPCKEIDAVNAQRAFGSGFQLDMTSITNKTLAQLIDKCVSPDLDSRPLLKDVVLILETLDENKKPEDLKVEAESTNKLPPVI
ncbi:hypothetical protein BLNAU_16556 [Blattamonas nauphoetae]|uniref:Protein kinase domain-containing protein n=1 Tax=Blattamonas nauphoetae TaxID=2049346 RepID=A0ABQ9X887_9EUKA|nr:hypothetical protein BLNAU_16556 [Blattamonas nauphoetae]